MFVGYVNLNSFKVKFQGLFEYEKLMILFNFNILMSLSHSINKKSGNSFLLILFTDLHTVLIFEVHLCGIS